jgi:aldehyde dehydrogenase (NAD+)
LDTNLHASNGHQWTQPLGLFINNEFTASARGRSLTTVDP